MVRNEAMSIQHVYWPDIIYTVCKDITNCDTCQCTKLPNKEYGKLPAKLAEEIPQNKLFVDLIWPYVIWQKCKKENLHLKSVAIIDIVTWWFEIEHYEDKRVISITNLVGTMWMSRYPRPIEITYYQEKGFIGHELK